MDAVAPAKPKGQKRNTQPGRPGYLADPLKAREGEVIGGGYVIFRRGGRSKRIRCPEYPFEHPTFAAAWGELQRLRTKHPDEVFEVFARMEER